MGASPIQLYAERGVYSGIDIYAARALFIFPVSLYVASLPLCITALFVDKAPLISSFKVDGC